jgi:hypothetical protein
VYFAEIPVADIHQRPADLSTGKNAQKKLGVAFAATPLG